MKCIIVAAALGLLLACPAVGQQGTQYQTKAMTPAQIDAQMANAKKYEFELAPDGGLIDARMREIEPWDLAAYLKNNALDKGGYLILWVTGKSAPLNTIQNTIRPIGAYGFTKIVVRVRPGETPAPPARNPTAQKIAVIQGKPNPTSLVAGERFPDLTGRPAPLRPGPLPRGIRYKFGSDAEVVAAAQLAWSRLVEGTGADGPLFARNVMVQPGAWKCLKAAGEISPELGKSVTVIGQLGPGPATHLEERILTRDEDKTALEAALRKLIVSDGGGGIRAMKTQEMAAWWPFISFDISEPTLVLQTRNGGHLLILVFDSHHIVAVDDLAGLRGGP